MIQVLIKGGKVHLETVPPPAMGAHMALVRVRYSLISSGTESAFVSDGGTTAYAMKKARDPLNVEKVKRKLASVGVKGTLNVIKDKLFSFQAPGYSTSGVIVACGSEVPGFRVGDRVACAGVGYACHAEYNVVPHQLLTPLPDGVDFPAGAFVSLGAIAIQGVRRAQPTFGETFVVVGLGLVGLLTLQIARAAGCRVIGSDPIESRRALAQSLGADAVCDPDSLADVVQEWTGGFGADGVIVCAASKGSAIANQAIELCRPKGRVSIVGAVGMNLDRASLYRNEIDFALSCSYGPGRYQAAYEEQGLDYPIGYVRWTEGRNMAEFLRMVAEGKVAVAPLVSVTHPIEDAVSAYGAVLDGQSETIAALLRYGDDGVETIAPPETTLPLQSREGPVGSTGLAVVGTGAFARAVHLPHIEKIPGCHLEAVVAATGASAKESGTRFGARYCTTDLEAVLEDPQVKAVVIATRHHLHGAQVLAALDRGKHVFVEKPLALRIEDCEAICAKVAETGLLLSVGFNRRFSPHALAAKAALCAMTGPKQIIYRCNAGALPPDHWTRDPLQGGGRILGEAVHFFDFCCWLLDAEPTRITAEAPGKAAAPDDLMALLRFADGSLATVIYCTTGARAAGKERIEIHGGDGTVLIDDFARTQFFGVPGKSARRGKEDKGLYPCLENFIQAVRGEAPLRVTGHDGLRATRIAFEALAAARGNQPGETP